MTTAWSFPARYQSVCAECSELITPGQMIHYVGLNVMDRCIAHADCDAACTPEPIEGAACPKCFVRRSLSGECGCDA